MPTGQENTTPFLALSGSACFLWRTHPGSSILFLISTTIASHFAPSWRALVPGGKVTGSALRRDARRYHSGARMPWPSSPLSILHLGPVVLARGAALPSHVLPARAHAYRQKPPAACTGKDTRRRSATYLVRMRGSQDPTLAVCGDHFKHTGVRDIAESANRSGFRDIARESDIVRNVTRQP